MKGADARMIERRCRTRFTLESLERLPILPKTVRQKLQGDESAEPRVFGFVDDAHPATADLLDDTVMGDSFADTHVCSWNGNEM
jgi:hypothetical protein